MAKKPSYEELEQRIKELKKEALKLRQVEKNLRIMDSAVASSINAIGITDLQGKLIYVNDSCVRMWGYDNKDEMLGRLLPEFWEGGGVLNTIKELREKYVAAGEDVGKRKDGSLFDVEFTASMFKNEAGDPSYMFGSFFDITDRKRAEEALRESEERFHLATKAGNVGVWDWDLNTGEMYISPNLKNMLGYEDHEIKNHIEDWDKLIFSEDIDQVMKEANAYIEGTKKDYTIEFRIMHKDGSIRWFLASGKVERDENGKAFRFVGTDTDITNLKLLEEELRQAHKMESIGTLAGGIAHELNNILGIIIGNNELALMDVPDWSPAKDCLKEIQKASLRAKDVVRNILSVARKTLTQRKPMQISTVIKESLKLLRATTPAMIEIRQNIECEREMILGDLTEINQILMNLCTNAIQAMGENAGILEVGLETVTLDKGSASKYEGLSPGNFIKLTVRDTGHGIDPKIIDRIFDPYFTTKSLPERIGMGLAIVYGLAKKHDGDIRVESDAGEGTVFEVLFPLLTKEVEQEVKEEPDALPGGTERILFVDDEEAL